MTMSNVNADPIAIVGLGAIFPGRGDVTGFWRDLYEGRDLIGPVPQTHWLTEDYYDPNPRTPDKTYGNRGGFIYPVAFDPVAFGIPPATMQSTDTAQLLALVAARMTLEDIARDSGGEIDKTRTSVVLGVASATELTAHMAGRLQRPAWINAMREAGLSEDEVQAVAERLDEHYVPWQEATFPGLLGNVIAGRIANRFDLGGSNYVTDAACASSLSALQIALHELRSGDSDTVLTGGVDALNDILMYMCFSKTPALSMTGDCRPFSTAADGTMLGEGIGMLALRRLSDAERDGNSIYALIKGLGGASDGKGTAIYSPLPEGQASALKRAYEQAGYLPDAVDCVEGHGTGTKAGDKAELDGLHSVFQPGDDGAPWCALGSVKSQIGHTKAAAGAASLVKMAHALSRKVLPPTIKVEEPAEAIRESRAFYLNTEARPWIAPPGRPRRAAVSSFGFGGSNFHVTLEEYSGQAAIQPYRANAAELFLFSGKTVETIGEQISDLSDTITEQAMPALATQTHNEFKSKAAARASIVASSPDDFRAKAAALTAHLRGKGPLMKAGCSASADGSPRGKIAFLFSGQGSQYVGMGADLAMTFEAARAIWDEAAGHDTVGALRLDRLSFPPAAFDQVESSEQTSRLTLMQHAQPAIAAVALSQLSLVEQLGLKADMVAGHSFGEILALHYAGVMDWDATLSVAAARGQCMADAAEATSGKMLAVQTDAASIGKVLDAARGELVLANDNAPNQVVLSGPSQVIDAAKATCEDHGFKARELPVATAFHSSIVAGAVEPFKAALSTIALQAPTRPVFANKSAAPYAGETDQLAAEIASQLAHPVRFRETIEAMYADGVRTFLEIGPGNVLSGLVGHILGEHPHQALAFDNKRQNGAVQFLSTVGALCTAGHKLDVEALFEDRPPEPIAPPPSKYAVEITGANFDKPYPPREGASGRANPNLELQTSRQDSLSNMTGLSMSASTKKPSPATKRDGAMTMSEAMVQDISQRHAEYLQAISGAHTAYLATMGQITGVELPTLAAPSVPAAAAAVPVPEAAAAAPTPVQRATHVGKGSAEALVRSIIAEKTGYPEDMLEADMDLEGELGVDSIKQVEILSTLRERMPDLPEIDPEQLVELRTIAAIANMIGDQAPAANTVQAEIGPELAPKPITNGVANGRLNVDTVRALIAEKTGYPEDMLEENMDLEGELGVDSIKQVEILSSLRELHPDLPEVDPEDMSELRTIRAIADFFA